MRERCWRKSDAADGLGKDPDAGAEHEEGFDAGGEAFDLAVAVGVVGVGGAVGDLDGEEGDGGGDEVDAGVRGLGEHAEGAGEEAGEEFEQGDDEGGEDGEERGGTLGVVGGARLARAWPFGSWGDATWYRDEKHRGLSYELALERIATKVEHDAGAERAWGWP